MQRREQNYCILLYSMVSINPPLATLLLRLCSSACPPRRSQRRPVAALRLLELRHERFKRCHLPMNHVLPRPPRVQRDLKRRKRRKRRRRQKEMEERGGRVLVLVYRYGTLHTTAPCTQHTPQCAQCRCPLPSSPLLTCIAGFPPPSRTAAALKLAASSSTVVPKLRMATANRL